MLLREPPDKLRTKSRDQRSVDWQSDIVCGMCTSMRRSCLIADNFQVVEEASAVLPGLRYIVLDSDHLKLNKFAGAQDGNFVSVSSNMARIAAQASGLIRSRRKGRSNGTPLAIYIRR